MIDTIAYALIVVIAFWAGWYARGKVIHTIVTMTENEMKKRE
jgi:hypothetical protein